MILLVIIGRNMGAIGVLIVVYELRNVIRSLVLPYVLFLGTLLKIMIV